MTSIDLSPAWVPFFANPDFPVSVPVTVPSGSETGTFSAKVWRDDRKTALLATGACTVAGQVVTLTFTTQQIDDLTPTGARKFTGYWEFTRTASAVPVPWFRGPFVLDPTHRATTTTALTVTLNQSAVTVAGGEVTMAEVDAAVAGAVLKVTYLTTAVSGVAADGWYYAGGVLANLTGRDRAVLWEGTAGQIPAQGPGDAQFQTGDLAVTRSTTL